MKLLIFIIDKQIKNKINFKYLRIGSGDWGLGIGDWAQSPIPNPQSPIPNPHFQKYKTNIHYIF